MQQQVNHLVGLLHDQRFLPGQGPLVLSWLLRLHLDIAIATGGHGNDERVTVRASVWKCCQLG